MITEDTQNDVLLHAAELLKQQEALKVQLRINEAELTAVARQFGEAYRIWGFRPAEVLRQACIARGIL